MTTIFLHVLLLLASCGTLCGNSSFYDLVRICCGGGGGGGGGDSSGGGGEWLCFCSSGPANLKTFMFMPQDNVLTPKNPRKIKHS